MKPVDASFGTKMFLLFTLFMTAASAAFLIFFIRYQADYISVRFEQRGRLLATVLARGCRLGVFSENRRLLEVSIDAISNQEAVIGVGIYNADGGQVMGWTRTGGFDSASGPDGPPMPPELMAADLSMSFDRRDVLEFWERVTSEGTYDSEEALFFRSEGQERMIGYVRVSIDSAPLQGRIRSLFFQALWMGFILWAIGAAVIFFLVRTINAPLRKLLDGVKTLESGGVFTPVPIGSPDEIGRLGIAFNQMAETLKRRKARLEETNRTLETLIEASPLAIVTIDTAGRVVTWNRAAEEMFGWPAAEVLGEACPLQSPEKGGGICGLSERIAEGAPPARGERGRCGTKTGGFIDVALWTAPLVNDRGETFRHLGVFEDITELIRSERKLKDSEALYRTLVETSPDAIALSDPEGGMLMANTRSAQFSGYETPEEMISHRSSILHLCDPEQRETVQGYIEAVLRNGVHRNAEFRLLRKDGTVLITELNLSRVHDADGTLLGIMGMARDMTERIEALARERFQQEQLIHADKMVSLGTVVAGVAHEINNPNNFIMLNATTLSKVWKAIRPILDDHGRRVGDFDILGYGYAEMSGRFLKTCADIEEGARRIREVVNELKRFSQKDASALLAPIDINAPVRSAVHLMNHPIRKATDRFTLSCEPVPAVKAHYQQIEQVVVNLLQNSCNALPDKEKSLTVRTLNRPEAGEVEIEITDEGVGISPEYLKRIFDPFFTTRRDAGGTGLGLSISEKIVQRHGGRLEFDSTPGRGTTARVILPHAESETKRPAITENPFENQRNSENDPVAATPRSDPDRR